MIWGTSRTKRKRILRWFLLWERREVEIVTLRFASLFCNSTLKLVTFLVNFWIEKIYLITENNWSKIVAFNIWWQFTPFNDICYSINSCSVIYSNHQLLRGAFNDIMRVPPAKKWITTRYTLRNLIVINQIFLQKKLAHS